VNIQKNACHTKDLNNKTNIVNIAIHKFHDIKNRLFLYFLMIIILTLKLSLFFTLETQKK
jgi:hypothetical protein